MVTAQKTGVKNGDLGIGGDMGINFLNNLDNSYKFVDCFDHVIIN